MHASIIVALIGLAGSVIAVAGSLAIGYLNNHMKVSVKGQEGLIEKLYALSMLEDAFNQRKNLNPSLELNKVTVL